MGVIQCKRKIIPKLKFHELDEFTKQTDFEDDKIESFYTHFYSISNLSIEDGVIDYNEFCQKINQNSNKIFT